MKSIRRSFCAPGLLTFFAAFSAAAIAPPNLSDVELARAPIVVVAKWNKAPVRPHAKSREENGEEVVTAWEGFSQLEIIRVLRGNVNPGLHTIRIDFGVSWSKDGDEVSSGTSTEVIGDVDTVSKPCLWFLYEGKSWDAQDPTNYLSVNHVRDIQPLNLENYFLALGSTHPEAEMPRLLESADPETIRRALGYVCGGVIPSLSCSGLSELGSGDRLLREQADAVKKVAERKNVQALRASAVLAYASLAGARATPFLRNLLEDDSSRVRAAAVAALATRKDEQAIVSIGTAVGGVVDPVDACGVISALDRWSDERLVPALISFLESGGSAATFGDDHFVPALKARQALFNLTGHQFAFNVGSSRRAWDVARELGGRKSRRQNLDKLQPEDPFPLRANIFGNGKPNVVVRLTNKSAQAIRISRHPASIEQEWTGGQAGCGTVGQRNDFITLGPGQAVEVPVQLNGAFLLAAPPARITLAYTEIENLPGQNPWVGNIVAAIGAAPVQPQ